MNMLIVDDIVDIDSSKKEKIQTTKNMLSSIMAIPESFLYQEKIDEIDSVMIIGKLKNISLFGGVGVDNNFFELRFFTDLVSVLVSELKKSFIELYPKQVLYVDTITLALQGVFRPNYVSDNVNRHVLEYLKALFFEKIDGESFIKYLCDNPGFVLKNVKLPAMENELIAQFPPRN